MGQAHMPTTFQYFWNTGRKYKAVVKVGREGEELELHRMREGVNFENNQRTEKRGVWKDGE